MGLIGCAADIFGATQQKNAAGMNSCIMAFGEQRRYGISPGKPRRFNGIFIVAWYPYIIVVSLQQSKLTGGEGKL